MRAMNYFVVFCILSISFVVYGDSFFITKSDYITGPYETLGYASAKSRDNPYRYLKQDMPGHIENCIDRLKSEVKYRYRGANGIMSLTGNTCSVYCSPN